MFTVSKRALIFSAGARVAVPDIDGCADLHHLDARGRANAWIFCHTPIMEGVQNYP